MFAVKTFYGADLLANRQGGVGVDLNWADVILLISGDGATNSSNNRTILDSSPNNPSITNTGHVTQGNFAPYQTSGWGSVFFGGGTTTSNLDYYSFPSNAGYALAGADDFTIEAWVYINQFSSSHFPIWQADVSLTGSTGTMWFGVAPTGIEIGKHGGGNPSISFAGTFRAGVWYHVRVTRSGTTTYGFQNGNLLGSSASFNGTAFSQNGGLMGFRITPNYAFGYISNFRLVKGTALSTAAFTVGTTPFTSVAGTQFLQLGTNAGIRDLSGRADFVTTGNAQITTSNTQYGSGAILFDNSGDYLTTVSPTTSSAYTPSQTMPSILTGDFTVEAWIYPVGISSVRAIIGQWNQTDANSAGFLLAIISGQLSFYYGPHSNATAIVGPLGTIVPNTWQHVAATRQGSTFRLFLNGALLGTGSSGTVATPKNIPISIGNYYANTGNIGAAGAVDFEGAIDNVRITRQARYTAAFSPSNFTATSGQLSEFNEVLLLGEGTNGSSTVTDSSKNAATITNVGITVTTAAFQQGAASLNFPGTTGTYITTPTATYYYLDYRADWSIDFYLNIAAAPGVAYTMVSCGNGANWASQLNFIMYMNASRLLGVEYSNGSGSPVFTGYAGSAIPTGSFVHIALTYSHVGRLMRTFVNGVFNTEWVVTTMASPMTSPRLTFGRTDPAVPDVTGYPLAGRMDQIRVSRGRARYHASFTPD